MRCGKPQRNGGLAQPSSVRSFFIEVDNLKVLQGMPDESVEASGHSL
jgi:hypothetical protein